MRRPKRFVAMRSRKWARRRGKAFAREPFARVYSYEIRDMDGTLTHTGGPGKLYLSFDFIDPVADCKAAARALNFPDVQIVRGIHCIESLEP